MATHSRVLAWRIPGTGGAWWAAVYGVAQSRTRLKRLSSSSITVTVGFLPKGWGLRAEAVLCPSPHLQLGGNTNSKWACGRKSSQPPRSAS